MVTPPEPGGAETKQARLEFENRDVDVVDVATIVGNIKRGTCDGRLDDVLEAVATRVDAVNGGIRWRIDFDEHQVHVAEDELTLAEARVVQSLARRPWLTIDPLNDVGSTIAILTALLHLRNGMDLLAASALVQKLPAVSVAQSISQYTVSGRPFDGQPTPSSTAASTPSAGPPPSPSSSDSATSPAS